LDRLRAAGLSPQITPIAREAFVFVTHRDNPVNSLTLGQIRDIYGKKIQNWREVGGSDAKILAFQRPEGSGSQSAMLALVMKDRRPAAPLREERMEGMGGMIRAVADYRNRANSLGYSFRWYASEQFPSGDIKFLAVDGIAPDARAIRSGAYPLTTQLVAVTCRPLSRESQALLDWLTGPEGQALIAKTGYVPLY
ncbi:MAG: substrate-binding domain-containing protein, partial [Desulfovibrio sp.]|nr:substrate-binding domain-containing protein [Desulfovibrio sp.]